MSNKIFRDIKPQTHLNRNGFDNSRLHNFTAKIGELLPVLSLETVPGGHYEINVNDLMRTIPMNNAAFIRSIQHFEFYFVPYMQLWHEWDNFYTTRKNRTSSMSPYQQPYFVPQVNMARLVNSILTHTYGDSSRLGDLGERLGHGMNKIANLLGYRGAYGLSMQQSTVISALSELKPNAFRAAAYQKICYDYYRQPYYDLPDDATVYAFNLDDSNVVSGEIRNETPTGVDRYPYLFQMHYRQWKKDLFTGVLPSTQFGAVSVVSTGGDGSPSQSLPLDIEIDSTQPIGSTSGSYLNSVYNSNTEEKQGQVSLSVNSQGELAYGSIPLLIGSHSEAAHSHSIILSRQLGGLFSNVVANGTVTIPASAAGSFDVLSLVRAQAIQKWREITLRSGFRATSQYEGHFGVKPIFTEKDKCVFIDSVSSPLQVNAVTNLSAQGDVALGDLAANGTSVVSSNKKIKFDAKDFGVIMCIYSVLPEVTYSSFNIDPMNMKSERDDFFTPEFENIGLQTVPELALRTAYNTDAGRFLNRAMGYVPRYAEYKIGVDRNSAEFHDTSDQSGFVGVFAGWSPERSFGALTTVETEDLLPVIQKSDFYVNPLYYRDVFISRPTDINEIGNSQFDTFIHQCYFDIKSVLPMSVLGLPNY